MDSTVAKQLKILLESVETLASQRDTAMGMLKEAQEEISDLKYQLAKAEEELRRARLDIEFLTLSRKLADNPQALADARGMVKGMLGRVEKALNLLKEDARI